MNVRQQAHIDFYLERLEYWRMLKNHTNARMLAARDADESHPLRSEEEAAEVVEHLRRLELSAGPPS
jgi:hypothetical protein